MSLTDRNYEDYFQENSEKGVNFAQELAQNEAYHNYLTYIQGINVANENLEYDKIRYENGDISAIDLAIKLTGEKEILEKQAKARMDFLNEISEQVVSESEAYGKQGYKGRIFSKQYKTTYSFKHLKKWQELDNARKDFEEKSKLAFKMVEKGGLNVDEDGVEIPLPQVTITGYLKTAFVK